MKFSIGKVEALHTITVAVAGLLIAALMAYGVSRMEQDQTTVRHDAVYLSDLQRLQDSIRQWLLMGDLIYASGETYLIEGASSQGELAKRILEDLTNGGFGEGSTISNLLKLIDSNAQRLQSAAITSPEHEAEQAYQLLNAWDEDSAGVLELLQELAVSMATLTEQRQLLADDFRGQFFTMAIVAGIVYLMLIVAMWAWVRAVLVGPLQALTQAADRALQEESSLDLAERGPYEVRRLTRSTKAFALQLEEKVEARTKALKDREVALVAEVASKQKAQMEAAVALTTAEAASAAKSEFLANMSHEIRTPLNGILGGTELTLQQATDDESRHLLKTVLQSGRQLLGVINDILDFSKLDAGQLKLENNSFDLQEIFQQVANLFAAEATTKDVEIILQLDPKIPATLIGDGQRVSQILANLFNNAVKFTDQGEITLRAELINQDNDNVVLRLSVIDTGCGIAPGKQKQVFEPFKQADGSTTRNWGGTGLGLSISRQFVQLMNGEIGLISEVDSGTTFWCRLPFQVSKVDTTTDHQAKPSWVQNARINLASKTLSQAIATSLESVGWNILLSDDTSTAASVEIVDQAKKRQDLSGSSDLIIELVPFGGTGGISNTDHLMLVKPLLPDKIGQAIDKYFNNKIHPCVDTTPISSGEKQVFDWRILVVEDNKTNQMIARKMLESLGCAVQVAESGVAGVAAIQEQKFDLVLMDWHMPEMDGLEATRCVRRWETEHERERTPIYALTANAMEGDATACLAAGMDSYLAKPINLQVLTNTLENLSRRA